MTPIARVRLLLVTLALLVPLDAVGGVLIVERTTVGDGSPRTHRIQIDGDWIRMEHRLSGDDQVFLFNGAREMAWIINNERKTYTELGKADVDRIAARTTDALQQMEEAMKQMRPEQRVMFEAMLRGRIPGAGGAAERTVYRKAGTDQVGRWACERWDGYVNERKTSELCTVEPSALGLTAADLAVSRRLAEFFKRLIPQHAEGVFTLGAGEEQSWSGVPVKRVFSLGPRATTTEVVEISAQSFPASTWEVPAGFNKRAYGER